MSVGAVVLRKSVERFGRRHGKACPESVAIHQERGECGEHEERQWQVEQTCA